MKVALRTRRQTCSPAAQAKGIADRLAEDASSGVVARMHEAFATAARYEWTFWDAPMRPETSPL